MVECCAIVGAAAKGLIDVGGAYAKGRFERIFPPGIELGAWGISNDSCLISGASHSVGVVMCCHAWYMIHTMTDIQIRSDKE
jgi:hypothetical protein